MFVGRHNELKELETLYKSKQSKLVILYGRRRIGKSSLVEKFCQSVKYLTFEGLENEHTPEQINQFIRDLNKQINDKYLEKMTFTNWDDSLDFLTDIIKKNKKKIVLFFDEFQWMAAGQGKLVSLIKKKWDNDWKKNNKVMLILCGSVASFMIKKVLHSNALYGRTDKEICLGQLNPEEIKELINSRRSLEETFKYILLFGGIPKYIESINPDKSFDQNINNLFLKNNALFLNEYQKIFYSQFKEHRNYEKIVKFLSSTPHTLKEIAKHLKMESGGGVKSYLNNLERALFITSYTPFNSGINSKLKKYKLTDEYIRFYLKYVLPNKKIIEQNSKINLFDKLVKQQWNSWTGFSFENFCLKNAIFLAEKMGFADQVKKFGPLFVKEGKGFQIDLIFERFDNTITVCEMKYTNSEVTPAVIQEVERKISLLEIKKGITVEKALVSQYGADMALEKSNYFHHNITVADLLS